MDYPDMKLDTIPHVEINKKIESIMKDEEVFIAAIGKNPWAIEYADISIKKNKKNQSLNIE